MVLMVQLFSHLPETVFFAAVGGGLGLVMGLMHIHHACSTM